MTRPAERVSKFYNGRGTAEQWIREGKNALRWTRLSCHCLPSQLRCGCSCSPWPTTSPISSARWCCLGRLSSGRSRPCARSWSRSAPGSCATGATVVFQLAEVAVPRALFAEILRLIDRTAAAVAAASGMSIASNERWQPDGRAASMIDRERPNAADRWGASRMTRSMRCPRLARALSGLPRAAERHIIGPRKPAIWGITVKRGNAAFGEAG